MDGGGQCLSGSGSEFLYLEKYLKLIFLCFHIKFNVHPVLVYRNGWNDHSHFVEPGKFKDVLFCIFFLRLEKL